MLLENYLNADNAKTERAVSVKYDMKKLFAKQAVLGTRCQYILLTEPQKRLP